MKSANYTEITGSAEISSSGTTVRMRSRRHTAWRPAWLHRIVSTWRRWRDRRKCKRYGHVPWAWAYGPVGLLMCKRCGVSFKVIRGKVR